MPAVVITEVPLRARTMNNLSVVVVPAASYRRICSKVMLSIDGLAGQAPISVSVHVGSFNAQPIASNFIGQTNTLTGRFEIPTGQNVFIKWSAISTNGQATFTVYESQEDVSSQILTWENAPVTPISVPETVEFQSFTQAIAITAGSPFFDSAIFDMRRYNSVAIAINLQTAAVATAYNPCYITFVWRLGPSLSDPIVFEDTYGVYAESKGGAFFSQYGRFQFEDAVRGPYLAISIVFQNGASGDTVNGSLLVYGNGRQVVGPSVRNTVTFGTGGTGVSNDPSQGQLYAGHDLIAAGATKTVLLPCAPGPACIWNVSFAVVCFVQLNDFQLQAFYDQIPALGVRETHYIALPKYAVRLHIVNTGGGNGDNFMGIISGRDSWY